MVSSLSLFKSNQVLFFLILLLYCIIIVKLFGSRIYLLIHLLLNLFSLFNLLIYLSMNECVYLLCTICSIYSEMSKLKQ